MAPTFGQQATRGSKLCVGNRKMLIRHRASEGLRERVSHATGGCFKNHTWHQMSGRICLISSRLCLLMRLLCSASENCWFEQHVGLQGASGNFKTVFQAIRGCVACHAWRQSSVLTCSASSKYGLQLKLLFYIAQTYGVRGASGKHEGRCPTSHKEVSQNHP